MNEQTLGPNEVIVEIGERIDTILDNLATAATGTIAAEVTDEAGLTALAKAVQRHIVAVDPAAPSCCIDGRPCLETLAGTAAEPRPSAAGGALVTAYGAYELLGLSVVQGMGSVTNTAAARLATTAERLRQNGIAIGTHCDASAQKNIFTDPASGKAVTGCGADDRFSEIILKPYREQAAVTKLVSALMGKDYDETLPLASRTTIIEHSSGWNAGDILTNIPDPLAVEVLDSPAGAPNHGHRESLVIFNARPGTTLDRDAFVAETGQQAFIVDTWYVSKLAAALADTKDSLRAKLLQAMMTYQVATYLTLCDGSQRAVFVH